MHELGYDTNNTILNLGTLYVLMVIYFIKLIIMLIMKVVEKFT
jgi:hypothetical protein